MRIAQWNANGLQQHKEEVKLFLNQNLIDILLLSETHFTSKNHFTIPGYDLCCTNHPDGTAHGGTAILLKNTIAYYEQLQYAKPEIQATSVRVKGPLREITITAVYCPPRHNLKAEHFEAFFQTLGPCFLAGGDFNSKHTLWGSRLSTTKGRELAKVIQAQNFSYLSTGTPTYWPTDPNKLPDLLDFFITNGISTTYADVQANYDLTSDHTPVIATITTSVVVRKPAPRLHTSQTNWDLYKTEVRKHTTTPMKLKTSEDIEVATTNFIAILQQAAKAATPPRRPSNPTSHLPSEIKRLVAIKRKARSKWQKTHAPDDRRLFNNASNKLKAALHKLRNTSFNAYISTLQRDDNTIWKPLKSRKRPQTPLLPIRKNSTPPGPWAKSDSEKVELFATHLAEVFTPHDDTPDPDVERQLATQIQHPETLQAFTLKELKQVIKSLNPLKAPGSDLITAQMIQETPPEGLQTLLHIYNAIIRVEYWPVPLKHAKVIMIPKPGKDPTDVTSYRPISLLPIISKILEKLLLKRIYNDTYFKEWIPQHQFGF